MTLSFEPLVWRKRVGVADGGWSTQLHLRGLPATQMAELANLLQPDEVRGLARAYVEAGAQFVTTNTFGANRFNLARRKLDHSVADLNRRGAELAREAVADSPVYVVGSIGPSGKILAVGEARETDLEPLFREQAEALAAGGADLLLLETFSEIAEIVLALHAAKAATGLPVIASMSFDSGPQRTRTMMGAKAEDCAAALDQAGADVIGCNCGGGIDHILPVVVTLRAATARPLWVKPNAGLPELEAGQTVWRQTPEEFAHAVPTLLEAGADIVGGCCGTGPDHIRRIAAVARRWVR